ncbi:MAG TPA: MotA/TolQ/ExbB proton channel family protein [Schlesneria sp.]|jgi:biopolymer transport protein ExbB
MASLQDRFTVPRWLVLASVLVGMLLLSRPVEVKAQAEPAAAAAPAAPAAHAPKSTLAWIIETSGWIGAFLLVISIFFIATVMRLFIELREPIVMPPELIQECEALLVKRDYNGIYRLAKDSSSELGQLIATGMAALSSGLSDAREAIDRLGEAITVEMEKRISMLAVVGTLGPLIGLLGTLKGMIASFSVIATSDAQLKASEVAAGISEALILTFEGVFLSVPAIYFFAVFKNRVSSLSVQSVNLADDFVRRVHNAAHKKAAEPTA